MDGTNERPPGWHPGTADIDTADKGAGPNERDGRILAAGRATSSVKRRSAWHGKAKAKPRQAKRKTAVYAGAPYHRSMWGPVPAPKGSTIRQPGQFSAALASRRPFDEQISDPEGQALWRATLKECGGDVARADVLLAARLRSPLTLEQIARHNARIDEALSAWGRPKWLRATRPTAVTAKAPRAPTLENSASMFGYRRLPPLEWRMAA